MTEMMTHTSAPTRAKSTTTGRLFVLELSGDCIHSMKPDGSDRRTIVTDCHLPDGIVPGVISPTFTIPAGKKYVQLTPDGPLVP